MATPEQRLRLYAVLAVLAGLGCAGIDYQLDANKHRCYSEQPTRSACEAVRDRAGCDRQISYDEGRRECMVSNCVRPCSAPSAPVTNCGFGRTNNGVPWTVAECRSKADGAGCTSGTKFSIGCFGYNCTDLQCAR